MIRIGPRVHREELIDSDEQDVEELARSLRQVAQVNRFLGGTRALRLHLRPHLSQPPQGVPISILDVGTGNGDVAAELESWANDQGTPCRVTGLDSHDDVIRVATARSRLRGGRPSLVRGDALAMPFADDAFDLTVCTLTLHHFGDPDAVRLLAEMGRVARFGVIVNDLERTALNYWAARALSWTWWRGNRLTRHDGPLSVLRSFTRLELAQIGERARLQAFTVHRRFPFRLVLEVRKDQTFQDGTAGVHRRTGSPG